MPSKYKIRLLRANLLAAAIALALLTPASPPGAIVLLWLSVGWLFVSAVLLDFSHRRSRGFSWQILPGALLLGLIVSAPERHGLLIWAWAALFTLPQTRWVTLFNVVAALVSLISITPQLTGPAWVLLLLCLVALSLFALSRARQLFDLNSAIRQRLRLMPGLNLWAGEQLLRDLQREQIRCAREGIYGELLVLRVKRHRLWAAAQQLCAQAYDFENVYRLDATTLAIMVLARTADDASIRRRCLLGTFTEPPSHQVLPLNDLMVGALALEDLTHGLTSERLSEETA
ncbi:hypothetical protein [Halomonas dongshanensis]|uniref:Diguanylate cyclase n=1 Tax=Halomonas dongshanensis TaxID=2890835 RepID=A0ABT2ED24_9GAMM|nr:hypothetical protein [Halomonas dongshanensis]MCS2609399.1 hypothetical protein [Halomonas dongshanensis]